MQSNHKCTYVTYRKLRLQKSSIQKLVNVQIKAAWILLSQALCAYA